MSHTPAPWKAFEDTDWGAVEAVTDDGMVRREICTVLLSDEGDGRDEDMANLRLIAASPDLLEQCEIVLAAYDAAYTYSPRAPWSGADVDAMRAAVKKARGT